MQQLAKIQQQLKAPKGQYNKFGDYKYRSCEDILEAVKPLLGDAILLLTDEIVPIGDRFYVKATAEFISEKNTIKTTAYAREALSKKGMDESQITGAASSYARKYALNGLFLIDDTKDADTMKPEEPTKPVPKADPKLNATKQKLVKTIEKYCEAWGQDADTEKKSITKIEGYEPTVEFFEAQIERYEGLANLGGAK